MTYLGCFGGPQHDILLDYQIHFLIHMQTFVFRVIVICG